MQRRTVLRGLAALAAGASAGCTTANREVPVTAPAPPTEIREASGDGGDGDGGSGDGDGAPRTPEGQRFVVPSRTFRADEDGHLLVTVVVENRARVAHRAVMTVTVGAGAKTFTPSRVVSLGPSESQTFSIHVPVPYDEFSLEPSFSVSFDPGRPATPLPEGTVTPYPEDRATATDTGTATSTAQASTATETGTDSTATGTATAESDSDTADSTADSGRQ